MPIVTLSRRQILLSASGFGLSIPLLPSLWPKNAGAAPGDTEKRFVAFATDHGGVDESAMFPNDSLLTTSEELYAGHEVRHGQLIASTDSQETRISEVLRGPSEKFTPDLVEKMNVIRGLDIPWYIAHHTGGHLGNYARNDGNGGDGAAVQANSMPTIDQLMAWSPNFYRDMAGITERALLFGGNRMSYNWSNPSGRSGDIQEVTGPSDPLTMFNRVFIPEEVPDGPKPRPPIVDRVFSSYQSLRQSDRRMSADDRQRLDDHMDRLSELQRRLNLDGVRRASCGDSPVPTGDVDNPRDYYRMINDVITTAFLCGTSRIAVVKIRESTFADYAGDWHQEIAHQHTSPEPQARLQEVNQQAFEYAILDLVDKLNVEEAPGKNVLDSALVQWTQESGNTTHEARSIPLVTFGSANGSIKVGGYCDYTKRTPEGMLNSYGNDAGYSGLLYSQWLAQALQALDVTRDEFQNVEHNAEAGYGLSLVSAEYDVTHSAGTVENADSELPFIGNS